MFPSSPSVRTAVAARDCFDDAPEIFAPPEHDDLKERDGIAGARRSSGTELSPPPELTPCCPGMRINMPASHTPHYYAMLRGGLTPQQSTGQG